VLEATILGAFRELLGRPDLGMHGSFFESGGDSLMAARLVLRVSAITGRDVGLRTLFERPTPAALAEAVAAVAAVDGVAPDGTGDDTGFRAIVPLQPLGTRPPIFAVPGHNGYVFAFRALARALGDDQPLFGLQPPGLEEGTTPLERVEEVARSFAEQIRSVRPEGPCVVAGLCAGGMTAFEVGRSLAREGRDVTVVLFAAAHPSRYKRFRWMGDPGLMLEIGVSWIAKQLGTLRRLSGVARWRYATAWLSRQGKRITPRPSEKPSFLDRAVRLRRRLQRATLRAAREYVPGRFEGRLLLLASSRHWLDSRDVPLAWRSHATAFEVHTGPDHCDTDTMLREPHVECFAGILRRSLDR
jgi:thioesterase domain-containing protein